MSLWFASFFAVNAILLIILIGQSRSPLFRAFAGSAINPLFIFCLISILFNIDFLVVWNTPEIEFLEEASSLSQETILDAYGAYTFIFFGATLGLFVALSIWARHLDLPDRAFVAYDPASTLSAQIVFFSVLIFSTPLLLWFNYHPPLEDLSYQVITRESPISGIAVWLLPGALALFVAYQPRPFSALGIIAVVFTTLLLAVSGGARVMPLLCLLIIGVAYASFNRMSALWYVPIIPGAALFLAFSRYVFREGAKYGSFVDFITAQGGFLKLFFGSEEVSFAKMFSAVYELAPSLPREPFESGVALLLAPIPRSLLAMKPYGASAAFTQHISPFRWEWTKSESLITGYGDLYWQFGTFGAFVAVFVLSFLWLWLCLKVIHSSRQSMIMWTPLLTWFMYTFVRGDIFNLGLLLWPTVILIILHRSLQHPLRYLLSKRISYEEGAL